MRDRFDHIAGRIGHRPKRAFGGPFQCTEQTASLLFHRLHGVIGIGCALVETLLDRSGGLVRTEIKGWRVIDFLFNHGLCLLFGRVNQAVEFGFGAVGEVV